MNDIVFRDLAAVVFFSALYLFSFAAPASERDRALKICETDYALSASQDCQCFADAFVALKYAIEKPGYADNKVIWQVKGKCQKKDNLNQTYASCMAEPKIINATIDTYCGCLVDELKKIQEAAGKPLDSREYSMSDAHIARQACDIKYVPQNREPRLSLEEKWRRKASDFAYKNAIAEDYIICTDFGKGPGQSAEKTQIFRYVNGFCPHIKAILSSNPTTERERIIDNVVELEEKLNGTYKTEFAGFSGEWSERVGVCETRHETCHTNCALNQAKTGRPTCGCGVNFLRCLKGVSINQQQ